MDRRLIFFGACLLMVVFITVWLLINRLTIENLEVKQSNTLVSYNKILGNLDGSGSNLDGVSVYYINMDKSIERKRFMETQGDKYGFDMTRVAGVDGSKLESKTSGSFDVDGVSRTFLVEPGFQDYSKSELGCTLAHLKAIKTAYDNGDKNILIAEDDLSFGLLPLWTTDMRTVMKNAPDDWEIIKLYRIKNDCPYDGRDYLPATEKSCWLTAAYLVNRKGMLKVADMFKHDVLVIKPIEGVPDLIVADAYIYELLKSYEFADADLFYAFNHNELTSTIHESHTDIHVKQSLESIKGAIENRYGNLSLGIEILKKI
jgi:GR25 family glycosyltransferase involved in LPS biosynthesis